MRSNRLHLLTCGLVAAGLTVLPAAGGTGGVPAHSTPQPRRVSFRILFTANTEGYIEPCDCSRGRLGGLDRRTTAIAQNRSEQMPTILIDFGNLFEIPTSRPMTELGRRQAAFISAEMERMDYDFVALGNEDLTLEPAFLAEYLPDLKHPPLLTNRAAGVEIGVETVPRIRLDLGGLKVDFFCIVEPDMIPGEDAPVTRWEEVLAQVLEQSSRGSDPADVQIVIAHVQFAVVDKIPAWYPDIDMLFHGNWQLPRQAFRIGTCVAMSAAGKGQMLGLLDASVLPRERQQENRPVFTGFQGLHVAMPPEAPFDAEVRSRMNEFRRQLIRDGLILP